MPLTFYPYPEDAQKGSIKEGIELLMDAAERYKSVVLDAGATPVSGEVRRITTPRELTAAYNWDEIARLLHQIRDLPEINKEDKLNKATCLTKLAEIYEVLRAAKMPKLEAVRLALISEANQLRGSATQVA